MIGHLLKPELTEMIHRREFSQLRQVLEGFLPQDIADIFADLVAEDRAVLLRILPQKLAADVFEHLDLETQEGLLLALGNEQVARILNEMEPDDRTALLEELPAAATQKLLSLLSPEERKIALTLLGYPEDSIDRRMTPEYVAVKQDWTVGQVLEHLRRVGRERPTLNLLLVVDAAGKLAGAVRLRHLVVAAPEVPVSQLLDPTGITLRATDDQETAIAHYETDLASALGLALFIPLIISSGGNSGAQASTLVIRALATHDVQLRDWLRVFRRELLAGLCLGGVLAVIGLLRIALWPNRATLYTEHFQLVALVVGFSLVGVVSFGSLVGAMLPFGLQKLKLDPATCSAPFVATLVDVTGLIIYFSVAQVILRGALL
jgi:Mg/Co/Ni transporter MgtE